MAKVDVADLAQAMEEGFSQETAEKVHRLLGILRELEASSATRAKFALKGGTALNLFRLASLPRLSFDLDLMAVGAPRASPGSEERGRLVDAVLNLARSLGYSVRTEPSDAACTVHCGYENSLGVRDAVKLDLDLLNRQTLRPTERLAGPPIFDAGTLAYPVVDRAELVSPPRVEPIPRGLSKAENLYLS